jgi:hypothetical protein
MADRSSKVFSLEVVNLSHRSERSSLWIGQFVKYQAAESHVYSAAIVGDLKKLETAVFDDNVELRGTGINGILQQLLQCVDRGDDYFTSGYLVDDILSQGYNASGLVVPGRCGRAVSLALGATRGLRLGH